MEKKKLLTAFAIITVVMFVIAGCKKDNYVEIVGKCPMVASTIPANGAVNVPLGQVISAKFNEPMNAATITSASFIVTGSVVAGTVTFNDSTATFIPDVPLIPNHTYTGRITTLAKDLMGNAIQQDYIWTFSTGIFLSPTVIFTDPVNNEVGVALNKVVSATFSMPMDPLTINDTTFLLKQGTTAIAGTVSYTDSTATLPLLSTWFQAPFIQQRSQQEHIIYMVKK